MNIALLIDYDNLSEIQKLNGIRNIATSTLMMLDGIEPGMRGRCDIRIYGGWYEETNMTVLAQNLSVSLQTEFPSVIRVPAASGSGFGAFLTQADLALSLAEEPGHYLFHTYRKKGKPNNLRTLSSQEVGCTNSDCSLTLVKRLLSKGKCPTHGCTISRDDLVYRIEQKIVDTMLTCDLLYFAGDNYDRVMLISDDDDFVPPLRTSVLRGKRTYRVHPKYKSPNPPHSHSGNQLIELEL